MSGCRQIILRSLLGLMIGLMGLPLSGHAVSADQDSLEEDTPQTAQPREEVPAKPRRQKALLYPEEANEASQKTEAVAEPQENAEQVTDEAIQTDKEAPFETLDAQDEDKKYVLQKGDRVDVKVFPDDEYIRGGEQNVSEEGNVRITTAGKVQVAGMTILTAEAEINKILQDYFVDPEVSIEVLGSEEKSFVILGEVQKPGTYPMPVGKFRFTLMEAIAIAGGFSEIANIKRITVTRKTPDGENVRISANAEEIIQGNEEDVNLQPDDIVHVKESFF